MKTGHLRLRTVSFKNPVSLSNVPTGAEFQEWLLALPNPPTGAALCHHGLRHGHGGIIFFYPTEIYGERAPKRPPLRVVH